MFNITTIVKKNFSGDQMAKQVKFATAVALTNTAKDGQKEVLSTLEQTFTLRGKWFAPSNKFGIKIKTARKDDLQSIVFTDADWLIPHETGETKSPTKSKHLAMAVVGGIARPNWKTKIAKRNTPRQLIESGNAFIMTTRSGKTGIYVFRKGLSREAKDSILLNIGVRNNKGPGKARKYSGPAPFSLAYGLQGYRTFKKQSTVLEPVQKIVAKMLFKNYENALRKALATAK